MENTPDADTARPRAGSSLLSVSDGAPPFRSAARATAGDAGDPPDARFAFDRAFFFFLGAGFSEPSLKETAAMRAPSDCVSATDGAVRESLECASFPLTDGGAAVSAVGASSSSADASPNNRRTSATAASCGAERAGARSSGVALVVPLADVRFSVNQQPHARSARSSRGIVQGCLSPLVTGDGLFGACVKKDRQHGRVTGTCRHVRGRESRGIARAQVALCVDKRARAPSMSQRSGVVEGRASLAVGCVDVAAVFDEKGDDAAARLLHGDVEGCATRTVACVDGRFAFEEETRACHVATARGEVQRCLQGERRVVMGKEATVCCIARTDITPCVRVNNSTGVVGTK
eukprot:Opistho-1_new@38866